MANLISGTLGMIVMVDAKGAASVVFPAYTVKEDAEGNLSKVPNGASGPWKVESTATKDLLRIGAVREYLGVEKGGTEVKKFTRIDYDEVKGSFHVAAVFVLTSSLVGKVTGETIETGKGTAKKVG